MFDETKQESNETKVALFVETQLQKFKIKEEDLQTLADKYSALSVNGVEDKEGLKAVYDARQVLKKTRIDIKNKGKMMREVAVSFQKAVIAREEELISIIAPIEEDLQEKEDFIKAEKERLKKEAEEAEHRKIQDRIQRLNAVEYEIDYTQVRALTDEDFEVLLNDATAYHNQLQEQKRLEAEEQARLDAEEAERRKKEEEELRFKAEEEAKARAAAEQEREELRKRLEEAERKIKEQNAEKEAQERKLQEAREAAARRLKEEEDRKRKAAEEAERVEREKKEAEERERQRQIQIEADKKAAIEKALREAEEKKRKESERQEEELRQGEDRLRFKFIFESNERFMNAIEFEMQSESGKEAFRELMAHAKRIAEISHHYSK